MTLSHAEKKRLKTKYGDWALVTGATSGIGHELALRLAESGLNVAITGRRGDILDTVARDLAARYHVQIKTFPGDLSLQEDRERLLESIASFDFGLAVMNAGFGTSGEFIAADLDTEVNMVEVNCKALLILTHYFAKKFSEKQRGGIILLSSMVGFQGVPYAANYAATKAYVQSLGEALSLELKPKGVDVLCAAPGPVETGFADRAQMKMGQALTPEDIGIPILQALGRRTTVLPGTLTKILVYSLRTVPRWGKIRIMKMVMGGMTKHQRLLTTTNNA